MEVDMRWGIRLAGLLVAATLLVSGSPAGLARPNGTPDSAKYLGRWNYDHPDRATMRNVAVIDLPGFQLQVPQIGDVVFSRDADGHVVGRTDQGCTWRFRVEPASLELDPPSQYCLNPTVQLAYTITRWSVAVSGRHERETVTATSHHPEGDFPFVLADGRRTRTTEVDQSGVHQFLGTWAYDAANLASRVNIRTTRYPKPDGGAEVVDAPQRGRVSITRDLDNRITARTDDGCTWSLLVRGSTAKLDPPAQVCTVAGGMVTLRFWTISSDGRQQASVMTGTDERGGSFVLNIGSLTRT
jgi:hypothetical protein